ADSAVMFHVLSMFTLGTCTKNKMSNGFDAKATRKRRIRPVGRNCIANSSSIKCRRSFFMPLIGTETKHSSDDQKFSSSGWTRKKSFTSPTLRIGKGSTRLSRPAAEVARVLLNLFKENADGFLIEVTGA